MNTPDIIAEAKRRLAELDAEADKLRRMIAVAEGVEPVRLVPVQPITFPMQPCVPEPPWEVTCFQSAADFTAFDLSTPEGWAAASLQSYSDRVRRSRGISSA